MKSVCMKCACSESAQELQSMSIQGMDVSAQNDAILQSVMGVASNYQKIYDYSVCMKGVAVSMGLEEV